MKIKTIVLTTAFLLMMLGGVASTADPTKQVTTEKQQRWVNIFPINTQVYSLVVDPLNPNSVYAATYKGVFKSIEGKNLWVPIWVAPSEVAKIIIKFDPVNVNTIYLGTFTGQRFRSETGKLLKSKDSGKTWEDITGVVKGGIDDVAVHTTSPEVIYVATTQGLFKTLNGGKTWGKIWDRRVTQVFLNSNSPAEVYATFWNNLVGYDLYYSKDGGEKFDDVSPKSVTTFIEDIFGGKMREIKIESVSYVALNPHDPQQLFAVASARWAGAYIYSFLLKSSDKGQSWQTLMDKTFVKASAFHPNNKGVIYIIIEDKEKGGQPDTKKLGDKILKSIDGGKKWIHLSIPYSQEINDIAKLHSDTRYLYLNISDIALPFPGTLYVATNYGIYKTINDGKSWEPKSLGLPAPSRRILWVDTHKKSIYVGDKLGQEGGYWVSDDEGITWKWHFGPDKEKERKYYVSSGVNQLIMSSDQLTYIVCGKKVFKLTLDGKSSTLKIPFPPSYSYIDLFTSSDPKILYAAGDAWATDSILLKSEDGGFSWIEIDLKKWIPPERLGRHRWYEITLLAVDPQSPNILYITVGPEDKRTAVLKTIDGGNSWTEIDIEGEPKSLAIDPFNSNVIYLQREYDLLRSNDGGKTLKSIKPVVDYISIYNIAIDPSNPTTLYLATDKGVYRSFDSGKTWQPLNRGLLDTKIKRVITSSYMILAEGENGIYKLMEE